MKRRTPFYITISGPEPELRAIVARAAQTRDTVSGYCRKAALGVKLQPAASRTDEQAVRELARQSGYLRRLIDMVNSIAQTLQKQGHTEQMEQLNNVLAAARETVHSIKVIMAKIHKGGPSV